MNIEHQIMYEMNWQKENLLLMSWEDSTVMSLFCTISTTLITEPLLIEILLAKQQCDKYIV